MNNDYFKSRYASFPQVKNAVDAAFHAHKLVVVERVVINEGGPPNLVSEVWDCAGRELVVGSTIPILAKDPSNPQSQGSGLTYARRQNYCVLGGVAPDDDDDGNTATRSKPAANESPAGDGKKAHARDLYHRLADATSPDHAKAVVADCKTDDERITALKNALERNRNG
jgi:hypothetical protein